MKKLYKSDSDVVLTGVLAGIAEYFSVDVTLVRLGFVILVLLTGIFPFVLVYIFAYFIIPKKPHGLSTSVTPPPMKDPKDPVAHDTAKQTDSDKPVQENTIVKQEEVVSTPEPEIEIKKEISDEIVSEQNIPHVPKWPVTEDTMKDIPVKQVLPDNSETNN